jgi:hypothetical protein
MIGALFGIWTWGAFASISAVGYLTGLVIFFLTYFVDKSRRITGTGIRIVGRVMCAAVPLWRFGHL